jgi:hypothetical protein
MMGTGEFHAEIRRVAQSHAEERREEFHARPWVRAEGRKDLSDIEFDSLSLPARSASLRASA